MSFYADARLLKLSGGIMVALAITSDRLSALLNQEGDQRERRNRVQPPPAKYPRRG